MGVSAAADAVNSEYEEDEYDAYRRELQEEMEYSDEFADDMIGKMRREKLGLDKSSDHDVGLDLEGSIERRKGHDFVQDLGQDWD